MKEPFPQDRGEISSPDQISGTLEWAVAGLDASLGCPHNCRYCYGRHEMISRKKLVTEKEWKSVRKLPDILQREIRLYPGQVMFPVHHDIVPQNVGLCLETLQKLLEVGNSVLIVSKPHLECVRYLCEELEPYKEKILFRFTITARDDELLRFWEPGAPFYPERLKSLKYAHEHGYRTSVSVEPMLDVGDVEKMIAEFSPYVHHSIWLGTMRKIEARVDMGVPGMKEAIQRIERGQEHDKIVDLYQRLKENPLLRWKDSIKQILGLPLADRPGKDM